MLPAIVTMLLLSAGCRAGTVPVPGSGSLLPVTATMSSTLTQVPGWPDEAFYATNCIDGRHTDRNMCHSDFETAPWLAIDFGKQVDVQMVTIFNRKDCCGDRFRNAEVRVTDTLPTDGTTMFTGGKLFDIFEGPAANGQVIQIKGKKVLRGRFVLIQLRDTVALNLLEVKVEAEVFSEERTETPAEVMLALAGGHGEVSKSAEVWSPDGRLTCNLPPLPEHMYGGHSVDLSGGNLMACHLSKCWLLGQSAWEEGPTTLKYRDTHTSAVLPDGAILLVGGQYSPTTTEIIRPKVQAVPGFTLSPGRKNHCSIQTGVTSIVLTGGKGTETMVQEYSGIDKGDSVTFKDLPSLNQGRRHHACGMYTVDGNKALIVAGGWVDYPIAIAIAGGEPIDSTETLQLSSTGEKWILRSGKLPFSRYGLRGVTLANIFYISGGYANWCGNVDSILAWTEENSDWTEAGTLTAARHNHAVASVPLPVPRQWCG